MGVWFAMHNEHIHTSNKVVIVLISINPCPHLFIHPTFIHHSSIISKLSSFYGHTFLIFFFLHVFFHDYQVVLVMVVNYSTQTTSSTWNDVSLLFYFIFILSNNRFYIYIYSCTIVIHKEITFDFIVVASCIHVYGHCQFG